MPLPTGRNEKHAVGGRYTRYYAHLNREELEGVIANELSHIKTKTC
jgi:hypothetical protein